MGRDLRRFGNQGGVDVYGPSVLLTKQRVHFPQDFDTADSANGFIRVRKVVANVAFADGAEQSIGNGMAENIRVGMPLQSAIMRNLDAAQNQAAAGLKPMRVVTVATSDHALEFQVDHAIG